MARILLFILLCTTQVLSVPPHVIYVDVVNGIENKRCWTEGLELPCGNLKLAETGRYYLQGIFNVTIREIPDNRLTLDHANNRSCPPWMFLRANSSSCECGADINKAVQCDSSENKVSILRCYCITYSEVEGPVLGRCLVGCTHNEGGEENAYRKLPSNVTELNDVMCGEEFNRAGRLCGQCKQGFSPLVYSYEMQCMNCTNMTYNWVKYMAVAFIPLTVFFFFVVLFKFNGTSPQLHAFIVLCQGFGSPVNARPILMLAKSDPDHVMYIRIMGCLYGVWNLDFFRTLLPPICLEITPLQAVSLDYIVASYPLLLVVITYVLIQLHARDCRVIVCLWRPFRKCFSRSAGYHGIQSSVVKAFATFLLLSYVKILDVTVQIVTFDNVFHVNGSVAGKFLYYDSSIGFFSAEHLPYAIPALVISLAFTFLPLLLLLMYPTSFFQKCLNCTFKQRQVLDTFVNCFQGYYKDGTEGTRDCRYFSVTYFLARIVIFILFSATKSTYCYSFCAIVSIVIAILILTIRPYKKQFDVYNNVDAIMILLFILILSV